MNQEIDDAVPEPADGWTGGLADLAAPAPPDFALGILRRVGIPAERYDTYVRVTCPAGPLLVAYGGAAVTGAALAGAGLTAETFEELYQDRTGRSVLPTEKLLPGLRTALRTGRARKLPVEFPGTEPADRAVLEAVRAIPAGQLRPLSWLAREAGRADATPDSLVGSLTRNPVQVLVPCHRVTYDDGAPCDASYLPSTGDALRTAEGLDMRHFKNVARSGTVFLGSDTTHIYCHPTCAHARRITPRHQVPFRTATEARRAGYRACKSCRPVTA
ncbi:Ada metal-binding domain-containing protein [Streptomyces niger]|uniref:Ada metal-binding domain-containing protein n=1 Tax=Streptomyces niger TaxID=66373 RepID=UPI000AACC592|nr:Ada metal-binding domain-containing protein [Streptomyces niger]